MFLTWSHIVQAAVCLWFYRPMPGRRCKSSAGHRTMPGQFYTDETHFHVQWCIQLYQNSPSFLQRNRLWKLETLMLTVKVMDVKTTPAQGCKHFNSTFSLHVIHPQLLKRNIIYLKFLVFTSEIVLYEV